MATAKHRRKVCAECLGDEYLARAIEQRRPKRVCLFCEEARHVATIEEVAAKADDRLRDVARSVTPFEDPVDIAAGVRYESDGYTIEEILERNLPRAKRDVRRAIAEQFGVIGKSRPVGVLAPNWASGGRYSVSAVQRSSADIEQDWKGYLDLVSGGSRFFNSEARAFLDELFDAAPRLKVRGLFKAQQPIREIKTGIFYRARLANSDKDRVRILSNPARELDAAPPHVARSGRMNAERVSVFYGAYHRDTALAELRPSIGGHTVVGEFRLVRPIQVLDMTLLERAWGATISIWDPEFKRRARMRDMLRRLHERVRRPVVPGAEHEYLATQVLSEYLSAVKGLDGVVFGSAQHQPGANIAIFPKALGAYDDELQKFPASPLAFVAGSERVVGVKGIHIDFDPPSRS